MPCAGLDGLASVNIFTDFKIKLVLKLVIMGKKPSKLIKNIVKLNYIG